MSSGFGSLYHSPRAPDYPPAIDPAHCEIPNPNFVWVAMFVGNDGDFDTEDVSVCVGETRALLHEAMLEMANEGIDPAERHKTVAEYLTYIDLLYTETRVPVMR